MEFFEKYQPLTGWNAADKAQCWLIVFEQDIVVQSNQRWLWTKLPEAYKHHPVIVCGLIDGKKVGVIVAEKLLEMSETESVRSLLARESLVAFDLLSHALQVTRARQRLQFCSQCGGKTLPTPGDWSQNCQSCNKQYYPIISPCIIVVIKREDEIFLARHQRHGNQSSMYTLIAGFVEPGESAEQAVVREVKEETGLVVGNLEYQFSQSWPFPHSLMLGFEAEYLSGDVQLDEVELCDGAWFKKDNIPGLPPEFTISRQLIDHWLRRQGNVRK